MNALAKHLHDQIQRAGPISFAEFMQRALYDPQHGYYSRAAQQIGKRGDFYTSVSVGPFFGELLAFQFARWIEALLLKGENFGWNRVFQCVEAGAHDGQLAFDVLDTLEDSEPKLFASLEYWIIEPLATRRAVQQKTLARFKNVRWFESPAEIWRKIHGVFFFNEVLDAMPVHVFRWNAAAQNWNEMGVGISGERLVWSPLPTPTFGAPQLPHELLAVLPDGHTIEVPSHATLRWWSDAASTVAAGKLMTIDYGGTFEELLWSGRTGGTLRAYSRHHVGQDILENPGEQDITSHVNFSELQRIGESLGLKTEIFTTQSQFLTVIARDLWIRTGSWPQEQVRQFQTLTHPEHLGRPFRVLVQSR
jgi:SAM-dependent MidA family methyltransferase